VEPFEDLSYQHNIFYHRAKKGERVIRGNLPEVEINTRFHRIDRDNRVVLIGIENEGCPDLSRTDYFEEFYPIDVFQVIVLDDCIEIPGDEFYCCIKGIFHCYRSNSALIFKKLCNILH
jgi:hypothetical protein